MKRKGEDINSIGFQVKAMRRSERAERVAALRDGRKVRATTFVDRKREASRKACRGKVDA